MAQADDFTDENELHAVILGIRSQAFSLIYTHNNRPRMK